MRAGVSRLSYRLTYSADQTISNLMSFDMLKQVVADGGSKEVWHRGKT